jgi:hypothetical protein
MQVMIDKFKVGLRVDKINVGVLCFIVRIVFHCVVRCIVCV